MKLANPRFDRDEYKYAYISITIDGQPAKIDAEQKLFRYGFIFVGADFEDILPVLYLAADPDDGRPEPQPLYGFSDDPRLLALYQQFFDEINSGDFTPHDVALPELGG